MLNTKNIILHFSALLMLSSCGSLNAEELPEWITNIENGYHTEHLCKNITLSCQSIPAELKAIMKLRKNNKTILESEFKNALNEFQGVEYFTFTLRHEQFSPLQVISPNQEKYFEYQDYIENDMRYEFYMITSTDTLFPSLYHVERYYNYLPEIKINLGFELPEGEFKKLIFENSIFGCEFLEFNSDRKPIPPLNF